MEAMIPLLPLPLPLPGKLAGLLVAVLFLSGGCGSGNGEHPSDAQEADSPVESRHQERHRDQQSDQLQERQREREKQKQAGKDVTQDFWYRLHEHCGEAFEGRLVTAAPGFDLLDGSERLIVHFRSCTDFETRLPFHIEEGPDAWDRSRTWVFFNHGADGLELRHDHRHQDGSEEDNTWYGGDAIEGGAYWQRFVYPPRTEEMGVFMGWRVEIHPNERFTYGTMRDEEWTFRVDFDLSKAVEPPPPPWGF